MDVTFLLVMIENPGLRHFVALDEIFHNLISARPRQLPACASLTKTALTRFASLRLAWKELDQARLYLTLTYHIIFPQIY